MGARISVIIPALDEAGAIGGVVRGLRAIALPPEAAGPVEVVVVDNGSRDGTAEVAAAAGAVVVREPRRGYGSACLRGIAHLANARTGPPEIVVFADGDGSNDPADLPHLLAPILAGRAELVIGSRVRLAAPGSLTPPQRYGSRLAVLLLRRIYGARFTDLGPYRAIAWPALARLGMEDRDYGWTVEMQIKAARAGVTFTEVDVHNRARAAGRSKVGGTVRGVVGASQKIVRTLLRHR